MNTRLLITIFLLPFFNLLATPSLKAQCNSADTSLVTVASIEPIKVTCNQNGAIKIIGATGGGGNYQYEIFDGPIVRGVQSSNSFIGLLPGKYSVRITGCNGKFIEANNIVIGNYYLEIPTPTIQFLNDESFKCNSGKGKMIVNLSIDLPTQQLSDSQFYSLPFTYQVIPANEMYNQYFDNGKTSKILHQNQTKQNTTPNSLQYSSSIIEDLQPGVTYFVRVTDQCGMYKTNSITLPIIAEQQLSYAFETKAPYTMEGTNDKAQVAKSNCVNWGVLSIKVNGNAISSIDALNTFAPLTIRIKNQIDGSIVTSRTFTNGNLFLLNNANALFAKEVNNCLFDSLPNANLTVEIIDKCGTITTLSVNKNTNQPSFELVAKNICEGGEPAFVLGTINGLPSLPLTCKIYNEKDELLINKSIVTSKQIIKLASSNKSEDVLSVQSLGKYKIVFEDGCGNTKSIMHNFTNQAAIATEEPKLTTASFQKIDDVNKLTFYQVVINSTSTINTIQLVEGPTGLNYPINATIVDTKNTQSVKSIVTYFEVSKPGNYKAKILYGCNQQSFVDIFVSPLNTPSNTTGSLSFKVKLNPCSSVGSKVTAQVNIDDPTSLGSVNDPAKIMVLSAPVNFLQSICINRTTDLPELPLNLGYYNANNYLENGIDTNATIAYPFLTFGAITSGAFVFQPGNYTFQLVGSKSGKVFDTKSFVIHTAGYQKPNLGASTAYICDDASAKLIISPIGGRRDFLYQIKLASDNEDAFSALQTDSIFNLPTNTKAGAVYTVRAIDACENSFTGQVVVNSINSKLFITANNDCIGKQTTLKAGYVPGAVYTWKKPDESIVVSNSNELLLNELSTADLGEYTVTINGADNCLFKTATYALGKTCQPSSNTPIIAFTASSSSTNKSVLNWQYANSNSVQQFSILSSKDGVNWKKIHQVTAAAKSTNTAYNYTDVNTNNTDIVYYQVVAEKDKAVVSKSSIKHIQFTQQFQVLKVYPSPFTTQIHIDFVTDSDEKVLITLTDLNGKEVSRTAMPAGKGINQYQYLPTLQIEAGSYLLSVTQGKNRYVSKVIKVQ